MPEHLVYTLMFCDVTLLNQGALFFSVSYLVCFITLNQTYCVTLRNKLWYIMNVTLDIEKIRVYLTLD